MKFPTFLGILRHLSWLSLWIKTLGSPTRYFSFPWLSFVPVLPVTIYEMDEADIWKDVNKREVSILQPRFPLGNSNMVVIYNFYKVKMH